MGRRAKQITVTTVGTPPVEGVKALARLMVAEFKKQRDRNDLVSTGPSVAAAQYLAEHPLTVYLKAKYKSAFHQIAAVRARPVVDVDPSSWPMVSATGLPRDVPRHLVKAHALLRWSVYESNPDTAALDSANRIIHESWLQIFADIGQKHTSAGKAGRVVQRKSAEEKREHVLTIFDRLKIDRPKSSKSDLVTRAAAEAECSKETVWRALRTRKSTVIGPD